MQMMLFVMWLWGAMSTRRWIGPIRTAKKPFLDRHARCRGEGGKRGERREKMRLFSPVSGEKKMVFFSQLHLCFSVKVKEMKWWRKWWREKCLFFCFSCLSCANFRLSFLSPPLRGGKMKFWWRDNFFLVLLSKSWFSLYYCRVSHFGCHFCFLVCLSWSLSSPFQCCQLACFAGPFWKFVLLSGNTAFFSFLPQGKGKTENKEKEEKCFSVPVLHNFPPPSFMLLHGFPTNIGVTGATPNGYTTSGN